MCSCAHPRVCGMYLCVLQVRVSDSARVCVCVCVCVCLTVCLYVMSHAIKPYCSSSLEEISVLISSIFSSSLEE